ncbi:DUF602 domain-containing protein [Moelleriella libera RCEF 2490]|uniref:DUF602 domain-containing protein n=1 Tax=Moelleriella libera RCEF 2490 TaxID=1081109 RepID=A0A168BIV7_9HYPO|nr:DUF602 domain-containing protein [Moelleriella libera RCEF 2490]
MGNDGGSIPKRRELVKNAARAPTTSELKATVLESLAHAWAHCALSGAPLEMETAVSDWRGRLLSYEAVLRGLMPSDEFAETSPASFGIRSLRDVVHLKFSKSADRWACPISMKELGPATKSVYLVPCGHVFAEIAITEIQEDSCPECGGSFEKENIITLLATAEEDVQRLEMRIENLREKGLTHSLKKDKSEKRGKRKRKEVDITKTSEQPLTAIKGNVPTANASVEQRISGINNSMAASLTAKVLAEQDERIKRRRLVSEAASRNGETTRC